jgi:hypothetical protein
MVKLNFNLAPCGKTYYEMNKNWKYTKKRIKQILDEPQKDRGSKIIEIEVMLDSYYHTYLKGEKNG